MTEKINKFILHPQHHPFAYTILLWLYYFLLFGRFGIRAMPYTGFIVGGLLPGGISLIYLYTKRTHSGGKLSRRDILIILGCVLYTEAAMLLYSVLPLDSITVSYCPFVPFFYFLLPCAVLTVYLIVRRRMTVKRLTVILFVAALVMHIFYIQYADFSYTQWDFGGGVTDNGEGHSGYIGQIYYHLIPYQGDPRDHWQFYHPPLHYYICAFFLRIQTLFGVRLQTAVFNLRFLTMLYSMLTIVTAYITAKRIGLRGIPLFISCLIIAFSPAFLFIAACINNDMLSVMFMCLALYEAILWRRTYRLYNILLTALFFGLGMFTKLSVWLVAVPIAIIFISELIKAIENKKSFGRLFGQMWAFLGVAAPLSFYWSLRNLFRFGIPIGYIPVSNSPMQRIHEDVLKRLFDYDPAQFFIPLREPESFGEHQIYNPIIGLIKSSLSNFDIDDDFVRMFFSIDKVLLFIGVVLCAVSFILMIYALFRSKRPNPVLRLSLIAFYSVTLISYLFFCIKYPDICTENIRYASPVIIISAYFTGFALQRLRSTGKRLSSAVCGSTVALVAAFTAVSFITVFLFGCFFVFFLNTI